jgi:hypothetical protein
VANLNYMRETNGNKKETGIANELKFEILIFRYALKFWFNENKFQLPNSTCNFPCNLPVVTAGQNSKSVNLSLEVLI